MIGPNDFGNLFLHNLIVTEIRGEVGFDEVVLAARDQLVAQDRDRWGDAYLRTALTDIERDLLAGEFADFYDDDDAVAEAAVASNLLGIAEAIGLDASILRFRALSTADRAVAALRAE